MRIYIDYIFIENFFITLLCLYETKNFIKRNAKCKRIYIGAIISSAYIILMLCLKVKILNFWIAKLLLSFVVIYIVFLPEKIKEQLRITINYWIVCFLNLGVIYGLKNFFNIDEINIKNKLLIYVVSFSLTFIIVKGMGLLVEGKKRVEQYEYKVRVTIKEKNFDFNAFLDTGNNSFCYLKNLPVAFAERPNNIGIEELNKLDKVTIKVQTINGNSIETGYVFKQLEIYNNNLKLVRDAIIVFINGNQFNGGSYNMILNKRMF